MLEVASSRTIIELRRSNARAIAINWRWPCEKLVPPADTCVSSVMATLLSVSVPVSDAAIEPSGTTLFLELGLEGSRDGRCEASWLSVIMCTRYKTSRQSLSSCSPARTSYLLIMESMARCGSVPNGSRFSRSVPEKSAASCNRLIRRNWQQELRWHA